MSDSDPDVWRDWNKGLERFDLSSMNAQSSADIIEKVISGEHRNIKFHRNFLRCAFRGVLLENFDLSRADWKDNSFIDTEFIDSDLSESSTVSCTFSGCTFVRCSFSDCAIHECLYQDCTFIECDFRSSMIRNSLLEASRFERCTTSNKVFEGCRLFSNHFEETMVDFAVITDNFGMDATQLHPELVRENRTYPKSVLFPFDARLADAAWREQLPPFEALKLQYYISGGEITGGEMADKAFEPTSWLAQVRAPVNLVRLLQDFGDFVLRLYDQDRIPSIFVLKLASLSNSVWQGFRDKPEHALLSQAGAGMYLQCVRELGDLDCVLANWLESGTPQEVTLRSFDDATDENIGSLAENLREVLPDAAIDVMPRNSPVDIVVGHLSYASAVFLLTLFFGTKTKVELVKIRKTKRGKYDDKRALFAIAVGGAKATGLTSALSLQTAMPGALVLKIDVGYSTALVERLRKVIKEAF